MLAIGSLMAFKSPRFGGASEASSAGVASAVAYAKMEANFLEFDLQNLF